MDGMAFGVIGVHADCQTGAGEGHDGADCHQEGRIVSGQRQPKQEQDDSEGKGPKHNFWIQSAVRLVFVVWADRDLAARSYGLSDGYTRDYVRS